VQRLGDIEKFRQELTSFCGEEPTILMTLGISRRADIDVIEVPLADYAGWFLMSTQAALYISHDGGFRRVAAMGRFAERLPADAPVALRLQEEGTFWNEGWVFSPIFRGEQLWGFTMVGPAMESSAQDAAAALYLYLYGLSIVSCVERRRNGLKPLAEQRAEAEDKALMEVEEIWSSMKPRHSRLNLLVLDEDPEVTAAFSRFFSDRGFDVAACRRETDLVGHLKRRSPHVILMDMDPKSGTHAHALKTARTLAPEALLLGMAVDRTALSDELLEDVRVERLFFKPCRFARLARELFEAAMSLSLHEQPAEAPARPQTCLIVEEESEAAAALKEHFEAKGIRTWTTAKAKEAAALAELIQPTIALLNVTLAKIPRADLIRQLRQAAPETRVVEMSSSAEDMSVKRTPAGPDVYCAKPASLERLNELVGLHG
jgi:DNA-binding response OmpR family regulator